MINSKIKLGWYFTSTGQNFIRNLMLENKEQLIAQAKAYKTKANLLDVENMLNGLFYGNSRSVPEFINQYQQDIMKATEHTIEESFQNFNLEAAMSGSKIKAKETVAPKTLKRWITASEQNLKMIENAMKHANNPEKLLAIKQQLEQIKNNANKFWTEARETYRLFGSKGFDVYSGNSGQEAVLYVKQMAAFDVAIKNGQNFSPAEFGVAFERALARSNQSYQQAATEDVAEELLDSLITGANPVNRGVNTGPLSFNINFSKPLNKAGQNKISKAGFSISENNFSANYTYNPNEAKQGKMDVILDFPTGNINDPIERLRVSAKNWNSTRTVGTTSIDAGLTRAVGFKVAEYYRMAMLNTGLDQQGQGQKISWTCATMAHSLAKVALATDIVMGLNQGVQKKGGLANVLIINDQSRIYVRDITDFVTNIDKIDRFLKGYRTDNIEGAAKGAYSQIKKITSPGRTESYLGYITSALNKMKVSYDLSKDLSTI